MSLHENIAGELKEISALVAGLSNSNIYEVPSGYFDALPLRILSHINEAEDKGTKEELSRLSTLLSDISNSVPYEMPGSYFSELAEDVVSGARAIDFVNQELEIEASLVHQMGRKNVYTVPGGYFFKLPYTLLQKVKATDSKIPFFQRHKKALSFAAAAVFAGVMSVASWSYFHHSLSAVNTGIAGIERIDAAEISSYLENNAPVSPSDSVITYSVADLKTNEIKRLLADVSDEDLENYIDIHSVSRDLASE